MSTDHPVATDGETTDVSALASRVEELEQRLAEFESGTADGTKKMAIIATKGSFDMAYPPLILASTAAAFGWEVRVFHTFWGLDILHKEKSKSLQLSAVGNPNMPVPNIVAALPGIDRFATRKMEQKIEENGTPTIEELIELSLEQDVELQACQMTMELMDYNEKDMHEGVTTGVGAATALQFMADADIQLLI